MSTTSTSTSTSTGDDNLTVDIIAASVLIAVVIGILVYFLTKQYRERKISDLTERIKRDAQENDNELSYSDYGTEKT